MGYGLGMGFVKDPTLVDFWVPPVLISRASQNLTAGGPDHWEFLHNGAAPWFSQTPSYDWGAPAHKTIVYGCGVCMWGYGFWGSMGFSIQMWWESWEKRKPTHNETHLSTHAILRTISICMQLRLIQLCVRKPIFDSWNLPQISLFLQKPVFEF